MKRFFYIFFFSILSVMSFSQVVSFDLSDTALSAEEVKAKTGKAVKLIYPTSMKNKIPAMECNVSVVGFGPFSVAEGRQVRFAPGNLQFNAALGSHQCADGTTQKGTWRFAEHQWDYVGEGNINVSETYDGWIDLFGWGTSGWNSGANAYQPWSTSMYYYDYYPGGDYQNNLTGAYANADWGIYNTIGSDKPGTWRVLTEDEWLYLCKTRANAANLKGQGTINGVAGFIFLPDNWELPSGLVFTAGTNLDFTDNTYSLDQWEKMEQRGAVFLPAAGVRNSTSMNDLGTDGYYWSSTQSSQYNAYDLYFCSKFLRPQGNNDRSDIFGVRLVRDY